MGIGMIFGRGAAVRREVERSRESLHRMAYAWCRDADVAADLVQTAIEKAVRSAVQLRDPARLRSWLLRILANCLRDHARAQREHVDFDSVSEEISCAGPTPEEACATAEITSRVRQAVGELRLDQRQIVTLIDLEDCSYAEVSEILDIPIGTVMSRLCRARQVLRERLRPLASDVLGGRLRSVK